MAWYVWSILTAIFQTAMNLSVRKLIKKEGENEGFSTNQILFFIFSFSFFGFLVLTIPTLPGMLQSPHLPAFLAVITLTGLLAVVGNWAEFTAIKLSPNAGFVQAIKTLGIPGSMFLSNFIFKGSLNLVRLAGSLVILLAILGLTEIRLSREVKGRQWQFLSLLATACWVVVGVGIKWSYEKEFLPFQILLFVSGINLISFTIGSRKKLKDWLGNRTELARFLLPFGCLAVAAYFVANYSGVMGRGLTNLGYYEAIFSSQIALTTLLSFFLLKDSLDKQKIFMVFFCLLGAVIIIIA